MIVSHKHKFIFVKTRKTAGTSLEIGLSQYCGPDDIITPITAEDEQVRSDLRFRGPQNFRIPTNWRQPRKIILSALRKPQQFYNHMPARDIIYHLGKDVWNDYFKFTIEREPYGKAISRYYWSTSEPRPTIEDYLQTVPTYLLSNWDHYSINDHVSVDFVIRFEHLNDDVKSIQSQLGLEEITMPRAKGHYRKDRSHYSEVLSPAARDRIELVCSKEIRCFGYAWDGNPAR